MIPTIELILLREGCNSSSVGIGTSNVRDDGAAHKRNVLQNL